MIERQSFPAEREANIEKARAVLFQALQKSFEIHNSLGKEGLEEVNKNQFGDTALKIDLEAEKAVLDSFAQSNFPVRVYSEEHGVVDIGDPKFLAVLDGIDGTALYKEQFNKGGYGTMTGVFDGLDPKYGDYLSGGVMQHATGKMFIGVKDKGSFVVSGGVEQRTHASGRTKFDESARIYVDKFFDKSRLTFAEPLIARGFNPVYLKSSALYYAALSEGSADLVLECTRKGNLEYGSAYGLIKEAGGVIVDMEGNDIGPKKYLEYGMKDHIPLITAATKDLALNFIDFLKSEKIAD